MKIFRYTGCGALIFLGVLDASAQRGEKDIPLMRPDERRIVEAQADEFNEVLEGVLEEASRSTVRVWGRKGRKGNPTLLAYGTVVGEGNKILTKWSEVEPALDSLYVQTGGDESFQAEVVGVFTDEDLALLDIGDDVEFSSRGRGNEVPAVPSDEGERMGRSLGSGDLRMPDGRSGVGSSVKLSMVPAEFYEADLTYGRFLTAPQPNGRPAAFGVVSVLERNLRESDQAHLGIMADPDFRGEGVKIANVQPEYGAAEAGLQPGDVILRIGERSISGLQELRNALTDNQPGDVVEVLVETAGKERVVGVLLSNRPVMGQFSGGRLNQMERMGGEPNRIRGGFSRVVQSDMKIQRNQMGGPVVDLEGRIVGVTVARADRTRTYLIGSQAVNELLEREDFDTVAVAKEKIELRREQLASQRRALLPRMRPRGESKDPERMKRHLSDLERLLGRANEELEALEDNERKP